jgi:hypothetical protein
MLNIKEFKTMIHSNFPNERADIIARHMKNKYFIKSGHLYCITENLSYEANRQYDGKLLNATSLLLQKSFKNLDDADEEDVRSIKRFSDIFNNSHIKTYLPQLIETITDENKILDKYYDEIHFINGLFNLATGKFSKRILGTHYITQFIQYEYAKPTPASIKAVTSILRKTYPLKEDFECICKYLGAALTGRSTIDQHALFLLGQGSSGKSNIMSVTELAIECYLKQLKGDTFSIGNTKLDKILNTYIISPFIRVTWINEPNDTKMDGPAFKRFCDGENETTTLFKDGCSSFTHRSCITATANTMPQIIIDTGTCRRINSYEHKSKFVSDKNEVDEANHIYLKDKDILQTIKEKNLHLAWFQILADYSNKWLKDKKIDYTENFKETTEMVIMTNDIIKDFIDGSLIITNDATDRVGKNQMLDEFKIKYPTKCLTVTQLMNSLREKKILYSHKFRMNGIQGCYYGVKIRETDDEHNDEDEVSNEGVDLSDKSVSMKNLTPAQKYEYLQNQLHAIQKQMNSLSESMFDTTPIVTKKIIAKRPTKKPKKKVVIVESDSESESESESSDSESEDEVENYKIASKTAKNLNELFDNI